MRRYSVLCVSYMAFCAFQLCFQHDLAAAEEVTFKFLDQDRAQVILKAEDTFVEALSVFDYQSRLGRTENVNRRAFLDFTASAATDWPVEQKQIVQSAIVSLSAKLKDYSQIPAGEITMIRTSGLEEAGAAYTRGSSIILPKGKISVRPNQVERLLAHELFHVISRNNPALRKKLYQIVGFTVMPPLELPAALADRKITNPDAPLVDCYLTLRHEGRSWRAAPILYASIAKYDPKRGGPFFRYVTFRMMELESTEKGLRPKLNGKQPLLVDPKSIPSFYEQIGRNTGYIIHPDEILADNFVSMIFRDKNLATPRIVERMRKLLSEG